MRVRAAIAASAWLSMATSLGCSRDLSAPLAAGDSEAPVRGGTLHLASFETIRGLDPAGPSEGLALQAEHLIFGGLVDFDDDGQLVADLADHWRVEDDGRTYRFVLREGVLMQDGAELLAEDVVRSVERALHPTTPNPSASYFAALTGYDAYASGRSPHLAGVAAEGRYAVSFRLDTPDATFLPKLAMHALRPVCRSAGTRYADTWLPCGGGPFKIAPGGWQRGSSLRLVRHDGYFRPGLPHLESVEWTYRMGVTAQRFRFEDGKLDLVAELTHDDESRFSADPRWKTLGVTETDRSVLGEAMNTRIPPFDRVEIRRAVAAAIDREHYRALKPQNVTVLGQLVPPGAAGYDPTVPGQTHDVAAALEHMRRAGVPFDPATGKGGWPDTVVYPLYDQGLLSQTAQLLQQDLAKIGIRLELKLVTWPAFLALQQQPRGAAMSQGNWEMDYPDPSALFEPLFTSASAAGPSSYNTAFYANPHFDDLVARARREGDPAARRALYRQANTLLCDEAPWAFAYAYHAYVLRQPYVRGYRPHPVWSRDVSHVWLDKAGRALERVLGSVLP